MKASRTKKEKKTGRGFLLNRPSCLNEDSVRDRTKLILSLFLCLFLCFCFFVCFFLPSSSSSMFLLLLLLLFLMHMPLFSVLRPLFLSSMFVETNRRLELTLLWGCEDGGWRRGRGGALANRTCVFSADLPLWSNKQTNNYFHAYWKRKWTTSSQPKEMICFNFKKKHKRNNWSVQVDLNVEVPRSDCSLTKPRSAEILRIDLSGLIN